MVSVNATAAKIPISTMLKRCCATAVDATSFIDRMFVTGSCGSIAWMTRRSSGAIGTAPFVRISTAARPPPWN